VVTVNDYTLDHDFSAGAGRCCRIWVNPMRPIKGWMPLPKGEPGIVDLAPLRSLAGLN
jgi:hypothetical protein